MNALSFEQALKGNPEFRPDQPRDQSGRWSAEGATGKPYDIRGQRVSDIQKMLEAQLPGMEIIVERAYDNSRIEFYIQRVDRDPNFPRGHRLLTDGRFTMTRNGVLVADILEANDDKQGRYDAVNIMRTIGRFAIDSDVSKIVTEAGLSMGGYLWPRLGFEIANRSDASDMLYTVWAAYWRMEPGLSDSAKDHFLAVAPKSGTYDPPRDFMSKIANLDDAVPGVTPAFIAADQIRGRPTLGKYLLAGSGGKYVLPRDKFVNLRMLGVSSTGKSLTFLHALIGSAS